MSKAAGMYPLGVVARFLGQRPESMQRQIQLDGLPAVQVNTETRPQWKVSAISLQAWLAERTTGKPLTVEQVRAELELCSTSRAPKKKAA